MINVGYLISYDFEFVFLSLKQLYKHVDKIYLALDIERKTWSGNSFFVPDSFFLELKKIDTKNKIEIYEDAFFITSNLPMQNETRERNMLADKMGPGWCIQLDADEYIYDFKAVKKFLKVNNYLLKNVELTPVLIQGILITLFKILDDGILYIENNERFNFITNLPEYTTARNVGKLKPHFSNIEVIHQSWARKNEEVLSKIKNWGHRDDFDTSKFYEFWQNLNSLNYTEYKNFHPLNPTTWNELKFSSIKTPEDFVTDYSKQSQQNIIGFPFKFKIKQILKSYFGWLMK
jgi:hypothetical protein